MLRQFNNFVVNGFREQVGAKTTIWCTSTNIWNRVRRQLSKIEFNELWIVKRTKDIPKEIIELSEHTDVFCISRKMDEEIKDKLGSKKMPSTGITAVWAAIQHLPNPISLIGFNGFDKNENHHYYTTKRDDCPHNGAKEMELLLKWEEEGLVNFIKSKKFFL